MIPRPEYPRPQFVRKGWMNLNGKWQFEIDYGNSGAKRGLVNKEILSGEILVPFCPESKLSGIGHLDFMRAVWYRKSFELPEEAMGKHILLHFGAVDYKSIVYVNGVLVGEHEGGYSSFQFDITDMIHEGENVLVVNAQDDTVNGLQPTGKQSTSYDSHECYYTRTTGIWQTVWLEWVNDSYIDQVFYTPNLTNDTLHIRARLKNAGDCILKAEVSYAGEPAGSGFAHCQVNSTELIVSVLGHHVWDVGKPELYDVKLKLIKEGQVVDELDSYFGLRSVEIDGARFLLNGRPVFQRLVLDQGFYPEGIYTAPSDEALKRDIELSMAMGFNGARLHEKIFEPRFLYHADKLGYLCWGEMGNWGLDHSKDAALAAFLKDWIPTIERDFSAPCIIGWCPFNETWDFNGHVQSDDVLRMTYRITKAIDPTRPCIDTSGNYHTETDIFDVHDYVQDANIFAQRYGAGTQPIYERFPERQRVKPGQPVFVSEYGGIWWNDTDMDGWGYGERVKSKEEFLERFEKLTRTLMDNPDHIGLVYTQLTDVEQEQNGLYTDTRQAKFPPEVIASILNKPAAYELKK